VNPAEPRRQELSWEGPPSPWTSQAGAQCSLWGCKGLAAATASLPWASAAPRLQKPLI